MQGQLHGEDFYHLHSSVSISAISSKPLKIPVVKAIHEHVCACSARHSADYKILTTDTSDMDLLTREHYSFKK